MINIEDTAIQIQEAIKNAYDNGYKEGSINSLRSLGLAIVIMRKELAEFTPEEILKLITVDIIPGAIKLAQDRFKREEVGNGHGK